MCFHIRKIITILLVYANTYYHNKNVSDMQYLRQRVSAFSHSKDWICLIVKVRIDL